MIELAYPLAGVLISAITAYCFLEWLKAFKRRNDLQDKFQAYERAQSVVIDQLKLDIANNENRCGTNYNLIGANHSEHLALRERFENLLGSHERLVVRVAGLEDHTKSEISKLGGEILGQVQEMKTQQSAAFQQATRFTPHGRNIKP